MIKDAFFYIPVSVSLFISFNLKVLGTGSLSSLLGRQANMTYYTHSVTGCSTKCI